MSSTIVDFMVLLGHFNDLNIFLRQICKKFNEVFRASQLQSRLYCRHISGVEFEVTETTRDMLERSFGQYNTPQEWTFVVKFNGAEGFHKGAANKLTGLIASLIPCGIIKVEATQTQPFPGMTSIAIPFTEIDGLATIGDIGTLSSKFPQAFKVQIEQFDFAAHLHLLTGSPKPRSGAAQGAS